MQLSKTKKRLIIILSIILVIILAVIFSINLIIASLLRGNVNAALEKNRTEYKVTLGGVGGNIFFGNIRFKNITIKPDSNLLLKLKEGISTEGVAIDAEIPLLRIKGISMYDAIVNQNIDIKRIEIRRANIKILKGKKPDKVDRPVDKPEEEGSFNPDSIYLNNVSGLSIGSIFLEKNIIEVYDLSKEEVVLKNSISDLEFTDFYIKKHPDSENIFYLVADSSRLLIDDEEFDVPGGNYKLKVKKLEFKMADTSLYIDGLQFRPRFNDKFKMASQWKYTKEIYDVGVDRIELKSLYMSRLVREGALYIDSVDIFGIDIEILKDKRYPFNESLRPKLIHQAIREMKMPLYIGNVQIHESYLKYQEKEEGAKDLMTVTLVNLNVYAEFITSVRDSARTGKPMKINLNARLMGKPHFNINFVLPLNSRVDTFFYSGSVGSAKLDIFDQASLPAIGVKFTSGDLQSITFKGSANRTTSKGKMTMLYQDLTGEVVKKDHKSKSKFLSWAANAVLKASNPNQKGKTRVALCQFDRVMYKGFGNFIWKTLQVGITNTVKPAGKLVKEEQSAKNSKKKIDQPEEQSSQTEEKESKKKKRKDKKKKKDK